MAAGAFTFYNTGRRDALCEGNWANDNHYAILCTATYTPAAAHATLANITNELVGGDYVAQNLAGESIALHTDATKVKLDANIISFGDPVTIEAKWLVILIGTVAGKTSTDEVVGYMDLNTGSGSATLASTNDSFSVDFHATNGMALVG